ncbi:MAG: GGDEF domain-containing protein [Janthinobacterium lividum]
MLFNLFSPRSTGGVLPVIPSLAPSFAVDSERERLGRALNALLEILPHSHSGRESVKVLCNEILSASSHLRFLWVGFCEGDSTQVKPYTAAGECAGEAADWRLPASCFDAVVPFTQDLTSGGRDHNNFHSLFQPWEREPQRCSARAALAIPLRSVKRGLRGVIVFYADTLDYFAAMGVGAFQAFCHVAEIIWTQSNLKHLVAQKSQQDSLTGLLNRRHMMHVLEDRIGGIGGIGAAREATSIVLCRIEGFNNLNSLYGWSTSDAILMAFSRQAMEVLGSRAIGARWTGVEFLFLMQGADAADSEDIAQRLRNHFIANPIKVENSAIRLGLSVGHATYNSQMMGLDDLILHASQGMQEAKQEFAALAH